MATSTKAIKKLQTVNAVVYARYSSHSQGEQSIDGQLSAAKKYAEAKGYTIVHEYIDRAMTGRNDNREEFQRMLSDCSKGWFQCIIVWKVDRFGRNREEITFNKYHCKKHGVRVEYVAENLPDSPESVILESVLEGMAEYYSLQLSQNIRRGLLESAKKHKVICGNLPLGYKTAADGTYEIDPDAAPTVRMIFDMYAGGQTMAQIVYHLNSHGYRTKKGKSYTKNSLPKILSNEKYIGIYAFKDVIRDEDAIPAIIDKEVFAKVQEMLKVNRKQPKHGWHYTDFLLTDKLFCGHCGKAMIGESGYGKLGVKYNYYKCSTRKKDHNACRKSPIRQDRIEPLVLEKVKELLDDPDFMENVAEDTWQFYLQTDNDREQVEQLQKEMQAIDKGIENLVLTLERVQSPAVISRLEELEGQKAAINKALADIDLAAGYKLTKDRIKYFLCQFRELDLNERAAQRRLVEVFINAIYVYDDMLKIVFNFKGGTKTITLSEINAIDAAVSEGADGVRNLCAKLYQGTHSRTQDIVWYDCVFILTVKLPPR